MASGSFDAWKRAADAAFAAAGSRLRVADLDPSEVQAAFDAGETPHDFANRDHQPAPAPVRGAPQAAPVAEDAWIGRAFRASAVAVWILGSMLSAMVWIHLAAAAQLRLRMESALSAPQTEGGPAAESAGGQSGPTRDWAEGVQDAAVARFFRDFQRGYEEGARAAERNVLPDLLERQRRAEAERALSEKLDAAAGTILLPHVAGLACLTLTFATGLGLRAVGIRWNRG